MSYYSEINRARKHADFIINEMLYVHVKEIDLKKLELKEEENFGCNFMKSFHKKLKLYMALDSRIVYDEKEGIVWVKEE